MMIAVFVLVLSLLLPHMSVAQDSYTPSACTHYASPTGSGSSCTFTSPCLINSFWSISSLPGKTLCLFDGTYTGGNSMIDPPSGKAGTNGSPITVRALNDGMATLDAQNGSFAVFLTSAKGNNWFVIDGIDAKNGGEHLYRVSGNDNVLRRVVGWNGTSGQADSNIFYTTGLRNRSIDCAGWGHNSRKIFDAAQAGNLQTTGFKRCWGQWNDWPQGGSQPTLTYQQGYNSTNQWFENVIGTWNKTGQDSPTVEGIFRAFTCRENCTTGYDAQGTKVLGSIFYLLQGSVYATGTVATMEFQNGLYMEDVVARTSSNHSGVIPFFFAAQCPGGCSGNTCSNCLSINSGTASRFDSGHGFSTPNFRDGNGLAAATGGTSAFTLLPGICKRYEGTVLTATPLWPWPMNRRIKLARTVSGFAASDVNNEMAVILGTIPSSCIATADRANVGGRTISGTVTFGPVEVWSTRTQVVGSVEAAGHTNGSIVLTLTLEASYDEGVNWEFVTSTKRAGGSVLDDAGNAQPNLYAITKLKPQVGSLPRLVRAKVNMASSSYVSSGGFIEARN